MSKKIGIINGSIREDSFSGGVAKAIVDLFPADYEVTHIEIDNLPLYSQDSDADSPEAYTRFRELVGAQDAFVFVTPEHNRSIPAALKNALDIASRPYGENQLDGKPALIASNSPGAISGFGANHHLRQISAFLNLDVVAQPEVYLAEVHTLIDTDGNYLAEGTKEFLQSAVDALIEKLN